MNTDYFEVTKGIFIRKRYPCLEVIVPKNFGDTIIERMVNMFVFMELRANFPVIRIIQEY